MLFPCAPNNLQRHPPAQLPREITTEVDIAHQDLRSESLQPGKLTNITVYPSVVALDPRRRSAAHMAEQFGLQDPFQTVWQCGLAFLRVAIAEIKSYHPEIGVEIQLSTSGSGDLAYRLRIPDATSDGSDRIQLDIPKKAEPDFIGLMSVTFNQPGFVVACNTYPHLQQLLWSIQVVLVGYMCLHYDDKAGTRTITDIKGPRLSLLPPAEWIRVHSHLIGTVHGHPDSTSFLALKIQDCASSAPAPSKTTHHSKTPLLNALPPLRKKPESTLAWRVRVS
jgi:hypothetical protein